jgi:hypothetical protein
MFKKLFLVLLLIPTLAVAWWLIAPIFFDTVVDESLSDIVGGEEVVLVKPDIVPETAETPEDLAEIPEIDIIKQDIASETESSVEPVAGTAPTPEPAETIPEPVAVETVPIPPPVEQAVELMVISSGSFVGLAGHRMSGTTTLLQKGDDYFVRFEDDFEVSNAPDMFVHLGKDGEYAPEARILKLKGNQGGQNYEIPDSIDVSAYNEVWVWCRLFSVPMGKAELK